jgi:hypothetical protein
MFNTRLADFNIGENIKCANNRSRSVDGLVGAFCKPATAPFVDDCRVPPNGALIAGKNDVIVSWVAQPALSSVTFDVEPDVPLVNFK